jgi:hypothetical protein
MTPSPLWSRACIAIVLEVSLLSWASGCSYAFVRGPPAVVEPPIPAAGQTPTEARAASCTSSNAAPVLDVIGAVPFAALGVLAIWGLVDSENCNASGSFGGACFKGPATYVGVAAAAFVIAATYIASAATGFGRTADCRQWQEALPPPPDRSERYLLDVRGIAAARSTTTRSAR